MHKLIDFVCDEMDDLERKADKEGKLSMSEVQYLDTLAHTKKNLLTAEAMEGKSERYYNRSYARKRDSMGRYSRAEDEMRSMMDEMRDMADDLPQDKQTEVRKFIERIERM